jgi:dihydrofolate reductase
MDVADLLHVTHIEGDIDGDTYFPPIDPALWLAGPMTDVPAGEKDSHATRFGTYRRVIAAN